MSSPLVAQDVLLPLEVNPVQAERYREDMEHAGDKVIRNREIKVDLNASNIIIIDDFSANKFRLNNKYWKDNYVYPNNNYAKNPPSIGVVTFDGLDQTGYPYEFSKPTSYGACDTLTSLPIQMNKVRELDPAAVAYLSFLYQPQGLNPFANSSKDSIMLQFKLKKEKTIMKKIVYSDTFGNTDSTYITQIVDDSEWKRVWGKEGDTAYNFKKAIIQIDSDYYKNGFQFRFVNFGNTSGNVDHWHLDNIFLSVGTLSDHENFNDVAFRLESGSQLKEYEAMPWEHYYDAPSYYVDTTRYKLRMSNSYASSVNVTLEYFAYDASGNQVDNITGVPGGVVLFGKDYKTETMPITGVSTHLFQFPVSSEPDKYATTYFMRQSLMINPDQTEIIKENNTMNEYQVFGTYYCYDDGSAEAGYGIRAEGGKLAYKFNLRDGLVDSVRAIYIYFNPVVVNRNTEKYKFTIWNDIKDEPGDIIYQDYAIRSPTYPKEGVNAFQRLELDRPVQISGTFYIGYEKFSTEVLNIGYDVNREARSKIFFDIGNGWVNGLNGSVKDAGALMMRPSFSDLAEPEVGVKKESRTQGLVVDVRPNPVREILYVSTGSTLSDLDAYVIDLQGQVLHRFTLRGESVINVSAFDPGMYILRVRDRSSGRVGNTRFIVTP